MTGDGVCDAAALRRVLVPDLVDGLTEVLREVEELLLTLAAWEEDPDGPGPFVLPAPLAGRCALDALYRIRDVLAPTQTPPQMFDRGAQVGARLLAPNGRYEHMPLHAVAIAVADLDILAAAAAAAALGHTVAVRPDTELAEAIAAGAEAAAPIHGPPPSPRDIIERLARLHGLLDLAVTDDTRALIAVLDHAGSTDPVVLDDATEAAYQRVADRMNAMWSGDALSRFLY
ncbi:hypothetical protein ACFU8R_14080 [Pseudonocardia alni]|uniref:hypothetical protein n=1 Tax=Pseudonocardia alni TaxID=33907 RepID=UPI00280C2260|nr:hypothetical protein [Pseudonocardia alni]